MNQFCRGCRDARELLERERARASIAETRELANKRLLALAASESVAMANGLLGWTRALGREFTSQASRDHALALMEARITSHQATLERLLDASSGTTSTGIELSLIRLPLGAVVEGAIQGQRGFAAERSVGLSAPHPAAVASAVVVLADRRWITHSMSDLLAECIRAAEIGSTVDVELTVEVGFAVVRLKATKRRVTVDDVRVGIVAAKHAALVHLGALETHGDGFVLRLPLFEPARPACRRSVKTMLVVRHEEPDIAEVLAALATAQGLRVLTVHDEELAASAFEVHGPDVVVVGREDGFEQLRALVERGTARIATISSAAQARELVKAMASEHP